MLPADFQFSQSKLQDFEVCPRRFQLRYLQRLNWPGIKAEPIQEVERLAQLGTDFHHLVYQHLMGLETDILTASLSKASLELKEWWHNYLEYRPARLAEALFYPELPLSTPLRAYRLSARFDLLAVKSDGSLLIVDWKTTQRKPPHNYLARHWQTRVYPYVLARAGASFNQGNPIDPALIKMIYWYPQVPDQPEIFDYSFDLFQRDEQQLSDMLERIKEAVRQDHFPKVTDDKPCRHCLYRSYCDRGPRSGPAITLDDLPQETLDISNFDWEQITEIEY